MTNAKIILGSLEDERQQSKLGKANGGNSPFEYAQNQGKRKEDARLVSNAIETLVCGAACTGTISEWNRLMRIIRGNGMPIRNEGEGNEADDWSKGTAEAAEALSWSRSILKKSKTI